MKAKEARRIATPKGNERLNKEYSKAISKIKKRAEEGFYSAYLSIISVGLANKLIEDGYDVDGDTVLW